MKETLPKLQVFYNHYNHYITISSTINVNIFEIFNKLPVHLEVKDDKYFLKMSIFVSWRTKTF